MKNEIKSLTGLRGIVAFWVVLFHFFTDLKSSFLQRTIGQGYLAVDIFFVLSAFLLTVSYTGKFRNLNFNGIGAFYKKRVNRIYPVYFLSIVVIILLIERRSLAAFLVNASLMQCFFNPNHLLNIVYWSLSTEWVCYLIFPFMLYLVMRYKVRSWILIIGGLFLRFVLPYLPDMFIGLDVPIAMGKSPKYLDIPYGINSLIRTIASYLLGIGIALLPEFKIKKKWLIYLIPVSFLCLLYTTKGLIFIPLASALLIKLLYTGEKNYVQMFLESRTIYFLGNISYSLYIIHYIIHYTAYKHHFMIVDSEDLNSAILIAFAVLLSYFSYTLIERKVKIFKV